MNKNLNFKKKEWENYLSSTCKGFLHFYFICFILLVISIFVMNIPFFISIVFFILFIPGILTIKRILRYGGINKNHNLASIYVVDFFYLLGRMLGFIEGVAKLVFNRKSKMLKVNNW